MDFSLYQAVFIQKDANQNGWVFSAAGGDWEYPAFLILANGVLTLLATVWHQTCRRSDNPRG